MRRIVALFRPRFVSGQLVRYAGYVSGIVAMSSVLIGLVMLFHETKFPRVAYEFIPETIWGLIFLACGLFHSFRLICWWAGRRQPYLEHAHLLEVFLSCCLLVFSAWSTVSDDTGWLVMTFVAGGAVLALITSQLLLWDYAAPHEPQADSPGSA